MIRQEYDTMVCGSMPQPSKASDMLLSQMEISLVLNQRKIFFTEEVDGDSVFKCMYYLHRLRDLDNKTNTKDPIEIYINSPGGSFYDGMGLVSLIEQMKEEGYKIITINIGIAASFAFLLLVCGSERKSYKYARAMYHDASSGMYGKFQDLVDHMEEMDIARDNYKEIIMKYTNLTMEQLTTWNEMKKDKWFSAQEMIEIQGVDVIC